MQKKLAMNKGLAKIYSFAKTFKGNTCPHAGNTQIPDD